MFENIFLNESVEYFGILNISDARIINPGLFERKTPFAKSIITFLIPYYTQGHKDRNISRYAISRDYHIYIAELTQRLIKELKLLYPNAEFTGMGDHSPIDERHACATLGLGVLGDNNCLINEKYGSYVFIAEIFTDLELPSQAKKITGCLHCGICKKACPCRDHCLSDLTQQKGELTPETIALMKKHNTAWGCDICQDCCPMNKNVKATPISFFYEDVIPLLTPEILKEMTDEELSKRAYGWRKRKTVERNINILSEQ